MLNPFGSIPASAKTVKIHAIFFTSIINLYMLLPFLLQSFSIEISSLSKEKT
jgi:hypothetical protein